LPTQKRQRDRWRDCRIACSGRLKETSGFFFLCQQQFNLKLQVDVSAACDGKEFVAGFGFEPQSRVEEALYFPPTFLVHGRPALVGKDTALMPQRLPIPLTGSRQSVEMRRRRPT